MKSRFIIFFLLTVLVTGSGCCHLRRAHERGGLSNERWVRTELYFGMNMPGGWVSDEDWNRFVRDEITPRFPAGLTVINAYGQWKGASGNIEGEPSHLVVIFHTADFLSNSRLEEIRARYCAEFKQEAVLRADEAAVVSFDVKPEGSVTPPPR